MYTRNVEGVVPIGIWVRLPSSAPNKQCPYLRIRLRVFETQMDSSTLSKGSKHNVEVAEWQTRWVQIPVS